MPLHAASAPPSPPSSSSSKAVSLAFPSSLTLDCHDSAILFDLERIDVDRDHEASLHTHCISSDPPSLRPSFQYYSHSSTNHSTRPAAHPSSPSPLTPATPELLSSPNSIDSATSLPRRPAPALRRQLTYTRSNSNEGDENMATVIYEPSSPPDLSSSRSSAKSSSDASSPFAVDDFNDPSHFEEISLSSENHHTKSPFKPNIRNTRSLVRPSLASAASSPQLNLSSPNLSDDLRPPVVQRRRPRESRRDASPNDRWNRIGRSSPSPAAALSPASSPGRSPSPGKTSTVMRSPSGGIIPLQLRPTESAPATPLRGPPWQMKRRKSSKELEDEIHDSDEELPEDAIVWNVPLTPRPADSRSPSHSPPRRASPIVRKSFAPRKLKPPRSKSWTDALGDLSDEVKALTAALETHADSTNAKGPSQGDAGPARLSLQTPMSLPVQRGHTMIDPLPVSKEKEKFLTRTRPSWLPPKCQKEEKKHLREWEQMMASFMVAEKKKAASLTKEKASLDRRNSSAIQMWEQEILPNWSSAMRSPQTREMWWQGIPSAVRGQVWTKAIGNDLHLSYSSYFAALKRANATEAQIARGNEGPQSAISQRAPSPISESELDASKKVARMDRSLQALKADIAHTFPSLGLFQHEQLLHRSLHNILKAYSAYRSDTGYIRGSSSVAALILLYLSQHHTEPSGVTTTTAADKRPTEQQVIIEDEAEAKAFIALSNLLNKQPILAFCLSDDGTKDRFASHVHSVLRVKAPRLAEHFRTLALGVDDWLTPMVQSCFTTLLDHVAASRLWDVLVFEGDAAAVRGAIGVLVLMEGRLYGDRRDVSETLGWKGWVGRNGEGVVLVEGRGEVEAADALVAEVRRAGRREVAREPDGAE